jgi:hypothetical protein
MCDCNDWEYPGWRDIPCFMRHIVIVMVGDFNCILF